MEEGELTIKKCKRISNQNFMKIALHLEKEPRQKVEEHDKDSLYQYPSPSAQR